MQHLANLLEREPVIFFHLVAAIGALLLGIVILSRRKGTGSHRALGWGWVVLMGTTVVTSAFLRGHHMPNIAGITPIHAFTAFVAWQLPMAVRDARRGAIQAHRSRMRGMFIGGCVIAGMFTLLPGRFLGNLLFHHTLGWV